MYNFIRGIFIYTSDIQQSSSLSQERRHEDRARGFVEKERKTYKSTEPAMLKLCYNQHSVHIIL